MHFCLQQSHVTHSEPRKKEKEKKTKLTFEVLRRARSEFCGDKVPRAETGGSAISDGLLGPSSFTLSIEIGP